MARKLFGFLALFAVLAAGAATVHALRAQSGDGMGMMGMMRDCPMMRGMAGSPDAVLARSDELGLTPEQVQRLEALRERARPDHARMMARMQETHARIHAVTTGETFDEAAARRAFDRMGELHAEMGVAMLRTAHEARQVLTPDQREKLESGHGGMMGMMRDGPMMRGMMGGMHGQGGMHGGMMENCPMMQGGSTDGHHGMKQEG